MTKIALLKHSFFSAVSFYRNNGLATLALGSLAFALALIDHFSFDPNTAMSPLKLGWTFLSVFLSFGIEAGFIILVGRAYEYKINWSQFFFSILIYFVFLVKVAIGLLLLIVPGVIFFLNGWLAAVVALLEGSERPFQRSKKLILGYRWIVALLAGLPLLLVVPVVMLTEWAQNRTFIVTSLGVDELIVSPILAYMTAFIYLELVKSESGNQSQ